eukprot:1140892-Pelagomonas_calceolata.AAC.9
MPGVEMFAHASVMASKMKPVRVAKGGNKLRSTGMGVAGSEQGWPTMARVVEGRNKPRSTGMGVAGSKRAWSSIRAALWIEYTSTLVKHLQKYCTSCECAVGLATKMEHSAPLSGPKVCHSKPSVDAKALGLQTSVSCTAENVDSPTLWLACMQYKDISKWNLTAEEQQHLLVADCIIDGTTCAWKVSFQHGLTSLVLESKVKGHGSGLPSFHGMQGCLIARGLSVPYDAEELHVKSAIPSPP